MSIGINKTLIIGKGEVGNSLEKVLWRHTPDIRGKESKFSEKDKYDILHICYPYSETFLEDTRKYIEKYSPQATVIHSTVPVGTTEQLGENVLHSPVRGKHPNLMDGLKTFVKEIGGSAKWGYKVRDYFLVAGIPAEYTNKTSRDTEFAKIMCTTRYGFEIVFCKEMKKLCDKYGIDFEFAYTKFNKDYNAGYDKLGDTKYHRSILEPIHGSLGGHCISNNCKLENNIITNFILERDKEYEND